MSGRSHMARVAEVPCVVCAHMGLGKTPAEVHHIGSTAQRSDYLTAALCPEHHRGPRGFHGMGQRAFERTYKLDELALLALTIQGLS